MKLKKIIESHSSLGDFIKHCSLEEDTHVVLCALLYLQQSENGRSISAEEINDELKKSGLALKNIHRLLYELTEENPPFVREVKQSEEYPPQSVFYSLTDEGEQVLEELLKNDRGEKTS